MQSAGMAATYKISTTLTVTDAVGATSLGGTTTAKVDCGDDNVFETQLIGTAAELLDIGAEVTAAGVRITSIRNMDETNFVTVYSDNGTTVLVKIPAGEVRIIEPDGEFVPYLKADTSPVRIKHLSVASAAA